MTKIGIDGTVFRLDGKALVLQQLSDHRNNIDLNNLRNDGNGWHFAYDRFRRRPVSTPLDGPAEATYTRQVYIPHGLLQFDECPKQSAVDRFNREAAGKGWNIVMPSESLNWRLSGKLPEVMIGDDRFIVDWRLRELRYAHYPVSVIPFAEVEYTDDEEGYEFFYHLDDKVRYEIPEDITELPDRVVLVRIPDEFRLDPVAVAREEDLGEMVYETKYPYRARHAAEVIPLAETYLPEMVADNRLVAYSDVLGAFVLVHPELTTDPHDSRGRMGTVAAVSHRDIQVNIPGDPALRRAYQADALLVFKPLPELMREVDPDRTNSLSEFVHLAEIARWVASGTTTDLTKAFERIRWDEALRDRTTITLQQELQRRRDMGSPDRDHPGIGR